jgi:hypothetical protein
MTKRKIARLLVLALMAVLAVPQMRPSPVKANPGSQTWYLTNLNFSPGVSGADYHMDLGSGNGSSPGDVRVSSGTSKVWAANEASNIVCRMSGGWTVTLYAQSGSPGIGHPDLSVDVGVLYLSNGTFTSKGTSATITVNSTYTAYNISVTTSGHTVNSGDRLALRVNATGNKDILIQTNGATNSPSYVTSPFSADDYPGAVIIDVTVTDYGSPGINFGSLDSGVVNQPEAAQGSGNGAVALVIGADTNINISVRLMGTNFTSGGNTIAIGNVTYNSINSPGTSILSTSYTIWYSVSAYTADTHQCYYWISVPGGQTAGNYTATFYYQAVAQ